MHRKLNKSGSIWWIWANKKHVTCIFWKDYWCNTKWKEKGIWNINNFWNDNWKRKNYLLEDGFLLLRPSCFWGRIPKSRKSPKAEAKKIKSIHDISLYKYFLQKLQLYNTKMQLKILIQCIQMQLVLSQ